MSEQIVVLKMSELSSVIAAAADQAAEKAVQRLPGHGKARPFHVTQKQAAEMLNLSPATVNKMVKFGSFTLNTCGLIPIAQVDRAMESS